eukprot:477184_1
MSTDSNIIYLFVHIWILSTILHYTHCQFTDLILQPSTMPINGSSWGTYYETTTRKIWLISPTMCVSTNCTYNGDIISYDIDGDIFDTQPSIPTVNSSMYGWAPRYAVSIDNDIYFNGDSPWIDKYNIKTRVTTSNLYQQNSGQRCLLTDGRFLFIVGGENNPGEEVTHVGNKRFTIYDTVSDQWYSGTSTTMRLR